MNPCEAEKFYEDNQGMKLHGCMEYTECSCGLKRCAHWRECPRCVRRERDKLRSEIEKIMHLSVNPILACGHNPDVVSLNNEVASLKAYVRSLKEEIEGADLT